jgi:hypothetical protein
MEVNDLTRRLTTAENRELMQELCPFPQLQLKLWLMKLRWGPTADKVISLATTFYSLFQLDKNRSIVYKNQQRQQPHKSIQTPLSYGTQQQDGVMPPQRVNFLNAYKVLSLSMLPTKTKETTFHILNRPIWTRKKTSNQVWEKIPHAFIVNHQNLRNTFCTLLS